MPKDTIDFSLYEPLEISVGEKIYTTVPFSQVVIDSFEKLVANDGAAKIGRVAMTVKLASLLYGEPEENLAKIDLGIVEKLVDKAVALIQSRKNPGINPAAEVEKNAPKPGADVTPQ